MDRILPAVSICLGLLLCGCSGLHDAGDGQAPRGRYAEPGILERDMFSGERERREETEYPASYGRIDELRDPGRFHDTGQLSW